MAAMHQMFELVRHLMMKIGFARPSQKALIIISLRPVPLIDNVVHLNRQVQRLLTPVDNAGQPQLIGIVAVGVRRSLKIQQRHPWRADEPHSSIFIDVEQSVIPLAVG